MSNEEENKCPSPRAPRRSERRRSSRIRLDLETAVPVVVRSETGRLRWGVARNISEGGMLIEIDDPPSLGEAIEIEIRGITGSQDSPDTVVLTGEVRHQMAWRFRPLGRPGQMTAIGVRFLPFASGRPLH